MRKTELWESMEQIFELSLSVKVSLALTAYQMTENSLAFVIQINICMVSKNLQKAARSHVIAH